MIRLLIFVSFIFFLILVIKYPLKTFAVTSHKNQPSTPATVTSRHISTLTTATLKKKPKSQPLATTTNQRIQPTASLPKNTHLNATNNSRAPIRSNKNLTAKASGKQSKDGAGIRSTPTYPASVEKIIDTAGNPDSKGRTRAPVVVTIDSMQPVNSNEQVSTTLANGTIIQGSPGKINIIMPQQFLIPQQNQFSAEELESLKTFLSSAKTSRGSPAASLLAPNALGGAGTSIFGSLSWVNRWPTISPPGGDGMGGAGVSFGDPFKYVGATFSYNQNSFGLHHDAAFAQNGGLSFSMDCYLTKTFAVAVGVGNLYAWGAGRNSAKNYYLAFTKIVNTSFPLAFNVGAGTASFASPLVSLSSDTRVYPFASMGVSVYKNLSAIFDWTSHQINLGGAYTISYFKKVPISISGGEMNVNHYENTSNYFQVSAGASYAFNQ